MTVTVLARKRRRWTGPEILGRLVVDRAGLASGFGHSVDIAPTSDHVGSVCPA